MTDDTTRRLALLDAILAARDWLPEDAALHLLALDQLNPDPAEWIRAEVLMETLNLSRCGLYTAMVRLRRRGLVEYTSRRVPGGYMIARYGPHRRG